MIWCMSTLSSLQSYPPNALCSENIFIEVGHSLCPHSSELKKEHFSSLLPSIFLSPPSHLHPSPSVIKGLLFQLVLNRIVDLKLFAQTNYLKLFQDYVKLVDIQKLMYVLQPKRASFQPPSCFWPRNQNFYSRERGTTSEIGRVFILWQGVWSAPLLPQQNLCAWRLRMACNTNQFSSLSCFCWSTFFCCMVRDDSTFRQLFFLTTFPQKELKFDVTPIDWAVHSCCTLIFHDSKGIFNFGGPQPVSVSNLLSTIESVFPEFGVLSTWPPETPGSSSLS